MKILFLALIIIRLNANSFECSKRESININTFLKIYKDFHKNIEKRLSIKENEEGPIVIPVYYLKNNNRMVIFYNKKYEIRDILNKKLYIYHNYNKHNKDQIVNFYETFIYNEKGKLITYKKYR